MTTMNAIAAARRVTELELTAADEAIFPPGITPVPGDALIAYRFHTERLNVVGYGDALAAVHRRSIVSYAALAICCRCVEALEDVASAAANIAARTMVDQAAASAAAVARYKRTIAEQLAAVDGHELQRVARAFVAAAARLEELAAEQVTLEQHAAAEQARLESEARAAAQAAEAAIEDAAIRADVEVALEDVLRSHGLPPGLREGSFVEQHRQRLELRSRAQRRLRRTRLSGVRFSGSAGRGLFDPADLARTLGDVSAAELRALLAELDRAEGRS